MIEVPRPDADAAEQTVGPMPDPAAVAANAEELARTLAAPPAQPTMPTPRWLGPLALVGLAGFVPWIVYLGFTLPTRASADDYNLAWLGFDIAMWAVMAVLAYCLIRRRQGAPIFAAVAATMLLIDAWFDAVLASDRGEFMLALTLALVVEIPLAIVCTWIAVNAELIRLRAYRGVRMRWQQARSLASSVSQKADAVADEAANAAE
ncbi:MAG: hypothetical protein QOD45_242 [Pseudonocardiales bacterium]|jgi:hypothetical protein|nr:hypothetical protein [Pseudonocardiales bacterium]